MTLKDVLLVITLLRENKCSPDTESSLRKYIEETNWGIYLGTANSYYDVVLRRQIESCWFYSVLSSKSISTDFVLFVQCIASSSFTYVPAIGTS